MLEITNKLFEIYNLDIAIFDKDVDHFNQILYSSEFYLETQINNLLGSIKTNYDSDLFGMFYNLDKNKYKYFGTPSANIIHNAISNKTINEVDPMIWYEVDPDAKYY